MFSFEIECDSEDRDLLIAELWEEGSEGIVELSPTSVRAFFEDTSDRRALRARFPGARERNEEQRDWVQSARDLLQPMEVGRRFFLVPEWRDDPAPEGRFRITINPGMAFGTGVHETTRLCIEALEDFVRPGMTVLDVGTGSGILARAASLLGASADVVVANISPEAIIALAPDLLRARKPGGVLLASGIESHEIEAVRKALPEAREVRQKGNWALLVV
jgi:ribosomal protein L11 methyltransferase